MRPQWKVVIHKQVLAEYYDATRMLKDMVKSLPSSTLHHVRFVSPSGVQFNWKALALCIHILRMKP